VEAQLRSVQLVGETTHRDAFVLDAIGSLDGEDPGQPIALVLARPDTVWFDAAIERLLQKWAADGRIVHVRVRHNARKVVAVLELEGGEPSLRLDLMAVA